MFDDYMANTWIAATVVALAAGTVGFFVVLRGAAFAAHALPLGSFPGAAAASLLGVSTLWGTLAFAALGVAGIAGFARHGRHDFATALTLAGLLGLGALLLSRTDGYAQATTALLFGDVLGVARDDLLPLGLLAAASLASTLALFRPLLLDSASGELGRAAGAPGAALDVAFLAVVALVGTIALPVVGALLAFSLMVGPASAARVLSDRPMVAMLLSALLSVATVWTAIALSFATDWPVGFFVGGLGALCYGFGRLWAGSRRARNVPNARSAASET